MFNDLKKDGSGEVDDIFADSDQTEETTKAPQSSLADLNLKRPEINKEAIPKLEDFDDKGSNQNSKKVLKTIILIFIILVIILVVAYIVYAKVLLPKTLQTNTNKATTSELVNMNTSSDSNILEEENINNDDVNIIEEDIINNTSSEIIVDDNESGMEILKNIDSDSDGLNDYDETYVYKTDPNNLDSDSDILSDYDEINIFGTDPLIVDSDGDTYSDGQEVMSGYNPLGDGKINSTLFKNQNLFIEKYPELASK